MPNLVIESAHTSSKHCWAYHDDANITASSAYNNTAYKQVYYEDDNPNQSE